MANYEALLVVSFGGPEKHEDVLPFLENVTRGRNIPRERLLEVAAHYYHFEGRSPINQQARDLIAALDVGMPIYWGNRNWHPLLTETVRQMENDGVRRALAFITSAFSSYSGCRQYRENIEAARAGTAVEIDALPRFPGHPLFLEAVAARVREHLTPDAELVFTAHSIPLSMASSCDYVQQLDESCAAVAALCGHPGSTLVYQSRSGPPTQPWLEPDICDYLRRRDPRRPLVIAPIGFLSDHIEVLWDLDEEALQVCHELGTPMRRAATVGTHPSFLQMIHELVAQAQRQCPPQCPPACCPPPQRPPTSSSPRL